MVYFSNWTMKATTRGARLLWSVVLLISSSTAGLGLSSAGRTREASRSAGESSCPSLGTAVFALFDGDKDGAEEDVLFLETLLAAERICFASFSSEKMD